MENGWFHGCFGEKKKGERKGKEETMLRLGEYFQMRTQGKEREEIWRIDRRAEWQNGKSQSIRESFFLPLDTDGLSASAGGLGVLSPDLEAVFVPDTSVGSDFEESLDVFSELGFKDVGSHHEVLSFLIVTLSVEEPTGDSVSFGFSDEFSNGVALVFGEFSCSEFRVDAEDFADEEAKPSADSLDLVKGEGDGPLSVDVGVEDTMDVLEVVLCVLDDQRHAVDNINLLFLIKQINTTVLPFLIACSAEVLSFGYFSTKNPLSFFIIYHYSHTSMASLRCAFLQTYHNGHCCFSLLTSLSCLYQLSCDDRSQEPTPSIPRPLSLNKTFERLCGPSKDLSSTTNWASETQCSSIVPSLDRDQKARQEPEDSSFVHILEILEELGEETDDLITVISQEITLPDGEQNSTENTNYDSDEDWSEVVDI